MQTPAETLQFPAYAFRLGTPHVQITTQYKRPGATAADILDLEIRRGRVRNNDRIQEVRETLKGVPARSLVWVRPLDHPPCWTRPTSKASTRTPGCWRTPTAPF